MKKLRKPNEKEMKVSIVQESFINFLNYMPNPDDVASGSFESYNTYRKMMKDPRIFSLLGKIKSLSLTFPAHIVQENSDDKVFEFIKNLDIFKNMYKKQKRILSALNYGFSISELTWIFENGMWIPDNIITRKPERFCFGQDWQLYLNNLGDKQVLNQDYKWLIYQHDPDDENPYGTSLLRSVYWAWMFKQAGYDFWLQATEKYSVKSIVAIFRADGNEEEVKRRAFDLAQMLQGIESGSSTALGNVEKIEQFGMDGNLNQFKELVECCDTQISYGLTGQSIATSNTNGGSLALGEVQADLIFEDCKGIALELQGVIQKIIDWTVELNFGKSTFAPQFTFDVERKASFEQLISAIDRKIPVSRSALYSFYGIPKPKDDSDSFVKEDSQMLLSDPYLEDVKDVKKNFRFY
ncbi:MAG: phage portal protein family protein [Treponemataceae bacterium]